MVERTSHADTFRILYLVVISFTVVLTFLCFALMFIISGETGQTDISDDTPDRTDNVSTENEAKITELENLIAEYDKILASNYLVLVNKNNPLPDGYSQTALLTSDTNPAISLEALTKVKIEEFITAAKEAGYSVMLKIGYRTYSEQETVYNTQLQSFMNAGYTRETAENMAELVCAKAGYSEFETGYTVEIAGSSDMTKEEMESSDLYQYIKENIYKYGFIQRYPQGKELVTEYEYNPFCYRYVGDAGVAEGIVDRPHSQYMYEKNLTLEEYLDYLKNKRTEAVQLLSVLKSGQ